MLSFYLLVALLCVSTIRATCADYAQPCDNVTAPCCQTPWEQVCINVRPQGPRCQSCGWPGDRCTPPFLTCCVGGVPCVNGTCFGTRAPLPTISGVAVPTRVPTSATALGTNGLMSGVLILCLWLLLL